MAIFAQNMNMSLRFSLTVLKFFGFLPKMPDVMTWYITLLYNIYWFSSFMFLTGGTIIAQAGDIIEIRGNVTLMISASFLFFTNLAMTTKVINIVMKRRAIQDIIYKSDEELRSERRVEGIRIIESFNRETTWSLCIFLGLSVMTAAGWAASAEKNQLPLKAWYPYDTTKSPVYELMYVYQTSALALSALVNVCFDTLVTSLIAVSCCRLRLVALSLRTLCDTVPHTRKQTLNVEDERLVQTRLQKCVERHEAALRTAANIQNCFTNTILAQFSVSIVIICVTAYQLALELNKKNWVRILSMISYLLCMMLQVFLYCYQGNQISEESSDITDAAYSCPWYMCSVRLRRALLIVMVRTRRVVKLTAGGFTTLSLDCFTSIIKASYTFFTVLKQVGEKN